MSRGEMILPLINTAFCVAALFAIPVVGSPSSHASPAQDAQLYDAMYGEGILLYPASYSQARLICGEVWSDSFTAGEITDIVLEGNPSWTYRQAQAMTAYSIAIYCPPADVMA